MICREFNCLYVHVPKTGGQSVEQFFIDRLGLDWDKDRGDLLIRRNENRACGTEKLAHLSATEYVECGHVSQAEYSGFFKFSFVRNPWSRILSEYRYRNYFHHLSFRDFVLNKLPKPGWDDDYRHVMPQYEMLHDSDGNLLVDYVGRFETLQDDFDRICEQLKIPDSRLPHRNKSDKKSRDLKRTVRNLLFMNGENRKRSRADFYDDETREAVAEYYQKDIETFGYSF
ncbi:sulfotransferase family 2 domain-containing protein [Pseudomonadota bacterium]